MKNVRMFSCKYEELLPISKFTLFSLKRDIAEFSAFSNRFNDEYVTETEAMINVVENLLEPQAETLSFKMISRTMEQQVSELNKLLLHIEGYLKLMKNVPGVTPKTFGVTALHKCMYSYEYEGLLKNLKLLISNVLNNLTALQDRGMPAVMPQTLQKLHDVIAENRQKQFEIKSNRAAIVQNNIKTLNDLYLRLSEIYSIGKVLYKITDPAKYGDYTFSALLKKVRNTLKSNATNASSDATTTEG